MGADQSQLEESQSINKTSTTTAFPFLDLPAELQLNVWRHFCPELAAEPYLLGFIFNISTGEIFEGDALARTTAASRALLAINQELRKIALKALPDTLAIRGGTGLVRFRRQRDVVILVDVSKDFGYNEPDPPWPNVPGFFDSVVNLLMPHYLYASRYLDLYCALPNLKVVYHLCNPAQYSPEELAWCFSDSTNRSMSLNMPATTVYWPDLVCHREDAENNIPANKFPANVNIWKTAWKIERLSGPEVHWKKFALKDRKHLRAIKEWPMVAVDFMAVWRPKDYLPTTEYTDIEIGLASSDRPFPGCWNHPRWPRPWTYPS
ncbi:hypothetical protein IMZ48_34970 [Candidatus Bathyarchaeota archaeon]|nr:hypothetical protein [Candidatus Bathyarchaeota archaeon]